MCQKKISNPRCQKREVKDLGIALKQSSRLSFWSQMSMSLSKWLSWSRTLGYEISLQEKHGKDISDVWNAIFSIIFLKKFFKYERGQKFFIYGFLRHNSFILSLRNDRSLYFDFIYIYKCIHLNYYNLQRYDVVFENSPFNLQTIKAD